MTRSPWGEKRRSTRVWLIVIALTAVTLLVGTWFISPPPPRRIVLATGQPDGAYYDFGRQYARRLGPLGLGVDVLETNGSIDNLEHLLHHQADVAFVQSGTYPLVAEQDTGKVLRGVAALYLEPLWVFYRGKAAVAGPADFRGRTISVGPSQSGTEAVSRSLLEAHGITPASARLLNLPTAEAVDRLKRPDGDLDVALLVASYQAPAIKDLLRQEDVRLLSFRRDIACTRQFPYLTPVKLAEGVLDLEHNIPAEDKTLLAPAALMVCRADLHPQVVDQLLKTATAIHGKGSLMDPPGKYPSHEGIDPDLPLHEEAETYLTSGESFLSRLLPYWAARWAQRGKLLLLPLLAVWLPFLKVLPMIYSWRVNRLLHRHYAALREVESAIAQTKEPAELKERLAYLEQLRGEMETLSRKVPAALQRDLYNWRLHVSLVRTEALDRLRQLEAQEEPVSRASGGVERSELGPRAGEPARQLP
jgi:TRAP transporter TAXI family solute receptor